MLFWELERYEVLTIIWSFLEVIDKIHLLETSKSTHNLCIKVNHKVPVVIEINQLKKYINDDNNRRQMLINLVYSFPLISKLVINDDENIFGESMKEVYNCDNLQQSLKSLKVILSDTGLTEISYLSNLLELDISMCYEITADGFSNLTNLINLTYLNMKYCCEITDEAMKHLSGLTKIIHLDLGDCCLITDDGINYLYKLINLKYLNIYNCEQIITNTGMIRISQYFTNLQCLKMGRQNKRELIKVISDNSMNNLATLNNLTNLDITRCKRISNIGIIILSNSLINLMKLNISYCYFISDNSMDSLSKLVNLTELNIMHCMKITDLGMIHLCKLPKLECLVFWCCNLITDTGISYFSNLKRLSDYEVLVPK